MELKTGDDVTFRFIPGVDFHQGTIVSVNETALSLRVYSKLPRDLEVGTHLAIPESPYSDFECYAEIENIDGDALFLKRLWMGKRAFLRVDDVFPVIASKVYGEQQFNKPRMVVPKQTPLAAPTQTELPAEARAIVEMLNQISSNIEFIIEKMYLDSRCTSSRPGVPVNISASGIKLTVHQKVKTGDTMELKMELPVYPPVVVIVNGEVVRTTALGAGSYEVALRFLCMDDDTTDAILRYTFARQQEMNRKK